MAATLLFVASYLVACATSYTLVDKFYGTTFFNNFDFFTAADPTHGYVTFVNQSVAQSGGLISASSNTAPVYMGADHTHVASGSGRQSVRITSKKAYNGALVLLDLTHMPTGCGTWPAFWMTASDVAWPNHGEIDIIEGVNKNTANAATLHTSSGCDMSKVPTSSFSGHWSANAVGGSSTNCYVNAANQYANAGCGVQATQANSYGPGFNSIQGGVYATLWDNAANGSIKIWFFPRSAIPAEIKAGTGVNPSSWGKPMTNFEFGSNCPSSHFANQKIIFDLTFCGDWAGSVFGSSGCSGSCNSFVQNNPSQFTEAYWIINFVKVYNL
jgi:hypothetical protein